MSLIIISKKFPRNYYIHSNYTTYKFLFCPEFLLYHLLFSFIGVRIYISREILLNHFKNSIIKFTNKNKQGIIFIYYENCFHRY